MNRTDILGVVRAYLMSEDAEERKLARQALADLFEGEGDDETARRLRMTAPLSVWNIPDNPDEITDAIIREGDIEDALDWYRTDFATVLEREIYLSGATIEGFDEDFTRSYSQAKQIFTETWEEADLAWPEEEDDFE